MRGGDTAGLRAYNERLVIDAILKNGPLSKAELARATGLSAQAASVIVNHLLGTGLVLKGDKVRGQVGQPSTPIGVNPDGAFSIGIKIGRRRIDAVSVNMVGETLAERHHRHAAPLPDATMETACAMVEDLLADLGPTRRTRVCGIGLAIPRHLHAWSQELGLAEDALGAWREICPEAVISAAARLPTTSVDDATAACAAELMLGDGIVKGSALYIYLGAFIGSGIVLDGKLYLGARANAGAIASMPTCDTARTGPPAQLLSKGSIIVLEERLAAAGIDLRAVIAGQEAAGADAIFEEWMQADIGGISRAVVSALSVIDFEAVVVDGVLLPRWRRKLVFRLREALQDYDLRGIVLPEFVTGSVGPSARVLGAALLPIRARFSPDPDLLVGRRQAESRAPEDEFASR